MRSRAILGVFVAVGMAVLVSQPGVRAHHAFAAEFDVGAFGIAMYQCGRARREGIYQRCRIALQGA